MTVQTIPRDKIIIGERTRRSIGDITGLVESIRTVGLLQAIGVTDDYRLVFGRRRLAALDELGVTDIPAVVLDNVTDAIGVLRSELDENVERAPFTPVEADELRHRIRALTESRRAEAAAAARESRRSERGTFEPSAGAAPVEKMPSPAEVAVDRTVSEITGVSVSTMQRVHRIAAVADDGRPEVAAVAQRALAAIDAGTAVKPQLDVVLAVQRWPQLAAMEAEPEKVTSLARYWDGLAAAGDGGHVEAEVAALASSSDGVAQLTADHVAAAAAFELRVAIDRALSAVEARGVLATVSAAAASMPSSAAASWLALAERMSVIAASIRSGLQHPGGEDD